MSLTTKQLIEQTFADLLAERPLSRITIKDITKKADINRNTFYYYFKNIPDLIESLVKDSVDEILAEHPPTYDSLEDCFIAAINYAATHKDLIDHIYHSTNRAIFERYLWKICDYTITSYVSSFPATNPTLTESELSVIRDFLKYEFFGFVIDWINHGMPEGAPAKISVLTNLLKGNIKHLE